MMEVLSAESSDLISGVGVEPVIQVVMPTKTSKAKRCHQQVDDVHSRRTLWFGHDVAEETLKARPVP